MIDAGPMESSLKKFLVETITLNKLKHFSHNEDKNNKISFYLVKVEQ